MAGPIRQPIDLDKLQKYLDQHVSVIKTPVDVKQFGYGQSNPTYLLTSSTGGKFVLRKKPPGKLISKTAHQVDREYRVIHSLQGTDVPVPEAICLCEDTSIIGTSFYIMSFLNGRIFEDASFDKVTPEHRREMWRDAVTTLAKFHRVPPNSVGMSSFGKPNNFYNRQLRTFATLSLAQAAITDVDTGKEVGKIPHYDDMVEFFSARATQPTDRGTFVHGDYKIDNLVFHPTEPRVIGILDWEMATIGHPLSDLTNLLAPFTTATHPIAQKTGRANLAFLPSSSQAAPGLPTKSECLAWYHETVQSYRFSPREVLWGDAFNLYRGAIICQGIAARFARRQASSEKAREYAVQTGPMGEMGWDFVRQCQKAEGGEAQQGKARL